MSTVKATYIQHPSAGSQNLVLAADGSVSAAGGVTGGGLDLVMSESFGAEATVSVDNCFTTDYENYRLIFMGLGSAGADNTFRLRASASDNTTSNYKWRQNVYTSANGSNTFIVNNSDNKWRVSYVQTSNSVWSIDLYRPQLATYTHFNGFGIGAGDDICHFLGRFVDTTQFDGFTFFPPTGTVTGTIRVYGFAK